MTRKIVIMLAGTALAWLLLAVPARQLWGDEQFVFSAVAAALCAIPASVTLALVGLATRSSPEHGVYALLAGTVLRMFGVLAAGFLLYQYAEYFRGQDAFLYWLLGFYLLTLALEKTLVLSSGGVVKREGTASSAT